MPNQDLKRLVPRYPEDDYKLPVQLELSFARVLKSIADFLEMVNKDRTKE